MDSNKNVRHRNVTHSKVKDGRDIEETKISEDFYRLAVYGQEAYEEVLKNLALNPEKIMNAHELYVLHSNKLPKGSMDWIIPNPTTRGCSHFQIGENNAEHKTVEYPIEKIKELWETKLKCYIPLKSSYKENTTKD